MALFNALIRPLLLPFVAPISLVLLGVLVLILQVVTFLFIAPLANGVVVDGFITALVASFVYAAMNTALTSILGVDRDGSFFGLLVSNLMAKRGGAPPLTSRASSSSRSTAWHTRSSPGASAPGRSTRSAAGSATGPTSSRAGRRSCRR